MLVFAGRMDEGWQLLEEAIDGAGHVQWATGQWDAAARTAQAALADGRGGITTRITAQYVLGYLAMGRADWSTADDLLLEAWRARRRFWEGTSALLDLAAAAARARRRGEAALLLEETRTIARAAGAATLVDDADRLTQSLDPGRPAEPWYPLSEREYEVAQLVEAGLTNRQIAEQLVVSPKTISAHITHILTKLGAGRRAEIAAWCATVRRDPPGR